MRPTRAEISLPALRANLARARSLAGGARLWAVVKANGYGHGLARVLQAFRSADGLALVEFDGAQRLRELGWTGPVLMLEGAFEPDDATAAARLGLTLAVHEPRQVEWLERLDGDAAVDVYLKFNSGMNRLGFTAQAMPEAWRRLRRCAAVRTITAMTHFAAADMPGGIDEALPAFERVAAGLPGDRSLANSATLIDHPSARGDWVRPGIMLYGGTPFADRAAADLGLAPGMTLRSRLISIQQLAAGAAVGYGNTFVADRPMRIGVVACGYADGYPRHAPTGTPVRVDGVRTRTVGRVAMDMLMVDLTPVPQARCGSAVELWGAGLPIDEVATAAGTIGYELMCALAPRVAIDVID